MIAAGDTYLDPDQKRRVEALEAARTIVSGPPFGRPSVMDVYRMAHYILTGKDPWAQQDLEQRLWFDGAGRARMLRADPERWARSPAVQDFHKATGT
jgi:hypothetical protein